MITERAVIGMFFEALRQNVGSWVDRISTAIMDSDQDQEKYPWLGQVPQMGEKKGEKKFSQLRETPWTVDNVEYQGGLAIPKKHILYDKTGQVQVRVDEQARRANSHWISIIAPLIINGESTVCYDGQYFFDTDHSEGDSGSQNNDITHDVTTTTAPTESEMIDAILKGIQQMLGFKDDRGEYVNEDMTEFLICLGTTLMPAGMKALSQSRVSSGNTNILIEQDSFRLNLQVSPRFNSWTDKFAIFSAEGSQKPIIRQQRKPNNQAPGYDVDGLLLETLWLDSEHCKLNDEVLLNVETERAAAYGDWKKACLVTLV